MNKVTAKKFYQAWLDTINETTRKQEMLEKWGERIRLTAFIKGSTNSVMEEVSKKLKLTCYHADYYSIDTVLYNKHEDLITDWPKEQFFLRDIRVAFEHENDFTSGLHEEVAHLLITNCDLRVLVTYPNHSSKSEKQTETKNEMKRLHELINEGRYASKISDKESFLLIFGYKTDFRWEGFVYKQAGWAELEK